MLHYNNGTREADFIIRNQPERLDHWLRKARSDRQRWAVRLFRPDLREFLHGFIDRLEAHAKRAKTQPVAVAAAALPRFAPIAERSAPPKEAAEAPVSPPLAAVAERQAPRREDPVLPGPVLPSLPALAPPPAPAPAPAAAARPAPRSEAAEPVEPASTPPRQPDLARAAGHLDGDRAIGVFRLPGWSAATAVPKVRAPEPTPTPLIQPLASPPPPAPRPPEIVWTNAMEHARMVGVVDLSSYDMVDYLAELRDIIDRRESLRQEMTNPDAPRGR